MNFKKIFLITLILLIALTLRLVNLNSIEVQTDEGNYALRAIGWNDFMMSDTISTPWNWYIQEQRLPWWTSLSFFDHPPLHFATIWLATHIFGIALWVIRLPAVVFGVLSVLLVILILQQFGLKRGACWAGLFLAILPWHIYICQQAIQESAVIFWLLLIIYLLLKSEQNRWYFWVLTGAALGAAMLTKYSAGVILLLVVFWFIKKKWYKNPKFWLMPLLAAVVFSPVIIYNFYTFQARHHFDLQIARLIGQDTAADWPASYQGIWQGSITSFFSFFFEVGTWIGMVTALFILLGGWFVWQQRRQLPKDLAIISFGMLLAVGILCTVSLSDYGRAAILIPFIALAVGVVAENASKLLMPLLAAAIIILAVVSLADQSDKQIFPKQIATSFCRFSKGFAVWEKWQKENMPAVSRPQHFSSFTDWMSKQAEMINTTEQPIIVFDKRLSWFGANWYFYRQSFYTINYPIIQSNFFIYLLSQNYLDLDSKLIYYVQVDQGAADTKARLDNFSKILEKVFRYLIEKQLPEPIELKNQAGEPFVKIWPISWDSGLRLEFE